MTLRMSEMPELPMLSSLFFPAQCLAHIVLVTARDCIYPELQIVLFIATLTSSLGNLFSKRGLLFMEVFLALKATNTRQSEAE